jgi:TatD DNase family protein
MHDSHVHLTTQPLFDYQERALENFVNQKGKYLLNCAYDLESSLQVLEIYEKHKLKYPNIIQNAIGIHSEEFHPDNKYKNVEDKISQLKEILEKNNDNIHAIGETGLEYYNLLNRSDIDFEKKEKCIEDQKTSLREHIRLALKYNLPMTIHSRDEKDSDFCTKDIVNIIATEGKVSLKGAMHSYVGPEEYLNQILELGLYVGFNGILTYKSGDNVRELLKKTPIERILIETDAPFLPPQNVRSDKKRTIKFGQPADVEEVAKVVAQIKGLKIEKVWEITTANYEHLFLN